MIKLENPNGFIEVTNNYFANLVGRAAQQEWLIQMRTKA